MNVETMPWLDPLNTSLAVFMFLIGLLCLLTRRNVIKQVIGLKIMLQGVVLSLVHSAQLNGDPRVGEMMVVSALIVEAVIIAIARRLFMALPPVSPGASRGARGVLTR